MEHILQKIKEYGRIIIHGHYRPDGDCIGSQYGLALIIKASFPEKEVIVTGETSEYVSFVGKPTMLEDESKFKGALSICVDCATDDRLSDTRFNLADYSIKIDHHLPVCEYGDYQYVDTTAPACAQIITEFYLKFKDELKLTKEAATALYVGISTDTGGFMRGFHGAVTPETWFAIADLVKLGADTKLVNESIFMTMRKPVFELYRKGLDRVEFYEDGKIAMLCITKRILDETGAELTDTHKLTDIIHGVEGVEITAIMTQKGYREQSVSVRAHNKNAQRICKYFGGGGHLKASGCRIYEQFYDAKAELLEQCKKELYRND